eukprot:9491666-Prorocentrum_lima.AAC.1
MPARQTVSQASRNCSTYVVELQRCCGTVGRQTNLRAQNTLSLRSRAGPTCPSLHTLPRPS